MGATRRPSPGTDGSTSASCADRGLVDAVAAEDVELGGEQVARARRRHAGGGTGSPSTRIRSNSAAARCVSFTFRPSCERSHPASRSASARGPVTESRFIVFTPGQSEASRPRQPTLRPQAMSETAIRSNSCSSLLYAAGSPRHSEESTTSRSQTSTSCSSSGCPHGGSPRQRQKVGRSVIRSGDTIEPGTRARAPPSRSSITSEQTSRCEPGIGKHLNSTSTLIESALRGFGRSRIVREGWSSSGPASVRRAAAAQRGGAQATCVITLVRVPSACCRRSSARRFSTWATTPGISAAARNGRRGGSARRRRPDPRSQPGSWGSSAGRAAMRPPSRRRAPTARPPRPSA